MHEGKGIREIKGIKGIQGIRICMRVRALRVN